MLVLETHLLRQMAFSRSTFGPGERTEGVTEHIQQELEEIADGTTPDARAKEWVDVVLLGLDGLWRATFESVRERCGEMSPDALVEATAHEVVSHLTQKQAKNELRAWPDWRTADATKAINHDRSKDS